MYCTECWGSHWHWFGIMPFLFMVLMFVFVAAMIRRSRSWRWSPGGRAGWPAFGCWGSGQDSMSRWRSETAHQILDRRYANGEITKEQYEQMKLDIEEG